MLSRQNGIRVEALVPFYFSNPFSDLYLLSIIMIVLLAESKTMSSDQQPVDPSVFQSHKPIFEDTADLLMQQLETLNPSEISEILGISQQLAKKARELAYDFPHKLSGYKALYGFTGEAFRSLDAKTLTEDAVDNADKNLKFISSVYGLLGANDIIKPYRCEFSRPIPGISHIGASTNASTPVQIFKPKITAEFVKIIKENKVNDIIDLLPGDADKCLDWKIIRAFAKVHKVVFQTISPDGKLKTPIAKTLKELRGLMARIILTENIQSFQELTTISSNKFIFSPADSKPGMPVFICG